MLNFGDRKSLKEKTDFPSKIKRIYEKNSKQHKA